MSGSIFEVWGVARFQPGGLQAEADGQCSDDNILGSNDTPRQAQKVVLLPRDGKAVELDVPAARLSRRLADELRQRSVDTSVDIPIPLGGRVLAKVVQYLKYHHALPSQELKAPLPSTNLVECGAGVWDANFVSVRKDELFEMMMAAVLLQIPSLVVLTNAKATLLMRGKSACKIQDDFGLSNDIPSEEEQELMEKYAGALQKRGLPADSQSLPAVAGILAGLAKAAVENQACESGLYEASQSLGSYRHFCWHAAVLVDWELLAAAPESVRGDRDLILAALGPSCGAALKYVAEELRSNHHIFLQAARHNPSALRDASKELLFDRDFIAKAVAINGSCLAHASDDIRRDRQFVLNLATLHSASALSGAAASLLDDPDFILQVVAKEPEAYLYAADRLRRDRDFALAAAEVNGDSLQHMSHVFKADKHIVEAALAQNPQAVVFAHVARRHDLGAVLPWDAEQQEEDAVPLRGRQVVPAQSLQQDLQEVPLVEGWHAGPFFRRLQKVVHFSAINTMRANMGQSNYIAANSFLDKLPFYQRPTVESTTLMWGPVGRIGMRLKAFGNQDHLLASPENLMDIWDVRRILHLTLCRTDVPEWFNACFFDPASREEFIKQTAGLVPGLETRATESEVAQTSRSAPSMVAWPSAGRRGAVSSPLGGWPQIAVVGEHLDNQAAVSLAPPQGSLGGSADEASPAAEAAGAPPVAQVCEGARVRLKGLSNRMNGVTGVVLKQFPLEGKWRVLLDGKLGKALLRAQFLEVIGGG